MNPTWFENLDRLSHENAINLPNEPVDHCPEESMVVHEENNTMEYQEDPLPDDNIEDVNFEKEADDNIDDVNHEEEEETVGHDDERYTNL